MCVSLVFYQFFLNNSNTNVNTAHASWKIKTVNVEVLEIEPVNVKITAISAPRIMQTSSRIEPKLTFASKRCDPIIPFNKALTDPP